MSLIGLNTWIICFNDWWSWYLHIFCCDQIKSFNNILGIFMLSISVFDATKKLLRSSSRPKKLWWRPWSMFKSEIDQYPSWHYQRSNTSLNYPRYSGTVDKTIPKIRAKTKGFIYGVEFCWNILSTSESRFLTTRRETYIIIKYSGCDQQGQ